MADSQKGPSSSSKEKTSLLDLDIGKDFLSSWKSMSVTEDDAMDFDFGTVAKGKKKAFNFDKADMDFNLDAEFGKISSFKVDMSYLDVLSPTKKPGKPKEKSKEVSAGGKEKTDRFTFPFDFNELDSLCFESSLMKGDEKSNKNQDREASSNKSGCQGSVIRLVEDIGALEEGMALKSGGETSSKIDTQVGVEDLDSMSVDDPSKFLANDNYPLKSTAIGDKVVIHGAKNSPEKIICTSTQETDQESCPLEKTISPESYAQETVEDLSIPSVSENASTQNIASELREGVSTTATKVITSTGGEQNVNVKLMSGSGSNNVNSPLETMPPHMTSSQRNNGGRRKFGGDNHVLIGNKDGAEPAQGDRDSLFEPNSNPSVSRELNDDAKADGGNQDSSSKLLMVPLNSGTTVDKLMPEKERETGVQSKFLKRSDEIESQLQQASLSGTKLTLFDRKRIGILQISPVDERREQSAKDAQSRSRLTSISRSHPRELTRSELVQSRESIKDPASTSSHVHPSSLREQAKKSALQNCVNPRLPVSSMTSIRNMKNICIEKNKIPHGKADRRTPDLSSLKISRTLGANHDPLNLTVQKDVTSLRNSEQSIKLQGKTESKMAHCADTTKQTSPTPNLKRKTLEELEADMLTLKPSKRLSVSPSESRNFREPSERVVDKQVCDHEDLADGNTRNTNESGIQRHNTPQEMNMTELETTLALENDSNFEKAEACTKELEDICSMLKKKHEEAKEILVRAIVNNNNLLMLNHPIYEEKIRMVQKFAALLMSK